MIIKASIEQKKLSLMENVKKAKSHLFYKCKENQGVILIVSLILMALTLSINTTDIQDDRTFLATTLLCIDYLLLVVLLVAQSQYLRLILGLNDPGNDRITKNPMTKFFTWFDKHNIAMSFILAFSAVLIFLEVHRINLIYNLTITFCLMLILYRIVMFIKNKLQKRPQSLDLKTQNIYIAYASFIALTFFLSTTVDDSDYGTQFQLIILSWLMLFHLLSHWVIGQWKLVKQLQNERTNAELMHLKSQVNPHFLFNTLNNLYGLALEKSDQTPGLILKLSDMLRYTIYQGKKDQVLLKDEISYLNDFIELQQIRYQKPVNITFSHEIADGDLAISPLLLLILVENAYKHGVEKLTDEAFILIKLEAKEQSIVFEIENNFDENGQNCHPGIGLQNLTQRLKLIYPDSHLLNITSRHGVYSVRLEIQLKSQNNDE